MHIQFSTEYLTIYGFDLEEEWNWRKASLGSSQMSKSFMKQNYYDHCHSIPVETINFTFSVTLKYYL